MSPFATLDIAVRALVRHTLRSLLTTLGIIIGVAAVIAMVALGEGARAEVEATLDQLGTDLLVVVPSARPAAGGGAPPSLTWDDVDAIRTQVASVRRAAPQLVTTRQVAADGQNWSTQIVGTTPELFQIRHWQVVHGQPFGPADVDGGAKVAVLGQTVVAKLFGDAGDPVGHTVRIARVPFTIVGVLARKGQSPVGQDYDDLVVVPASTFAAKLEGGRSKLVSGQALVSAVSSDATARAQRQIAELLRARHHLPPGVEDDFDVKNLAQLARARRDAGKTLTLLLASIAAVSLVVGGIGIMNIMLVGVSERTREIGVRLAVGARPRHILAQFLIEASILAVIGGLVGVAVGVVAAHRMSAGFGWPTHVRWDVAAIAVGFSAAVGVVFGLYPAHQASRLDPIEALRCE